MNEQPHDDREAAPARDRTLSVIKKIHIETVTIAAIAVFAVSVLVWGHWWAPAPKPNIADLDQQVTAGLQNRFNTDNDMKPYGLNVGTDMALINVTGGGNEYRGLVTVNTNKNTAVPIAITIYADGHNLMWEIDPGSNVRLMTAAAKDSQT